jgi:hypothetical protein
MYVGTRTWIPQELDTDSSESEYWLKGLLSENIFEYSAVIKFLTPEKVFFDEKKISSGLVGSLWMTANWLLHNGN